MSTIIHIEVQQNLDQLGGHEEFTWDLSPFVSEISHLDNKGLAQVGTYLKPGMVIVGKIGRTKKFDQAKMHSCLAMLALSRKELRSMYRTMLYDASLYANHETAGVIKNAYFEPISESLVKAIVEIEIDK